MNMENMKCEPSEIGVLVGKTIKQIEVKNGDEIYFYLVDGQIVEMSHKIVAKV